MRNRHYGKTPVWISFTIITFIDLFLAYRCFLFLCLYRQSDVSCNSRQEIIEHAKQPILLFDYDNQLFLSNQSAKKLFPFIADRNGSLDIHDFISSLGLKEQVPDLKQDIQFYWTSQDSGHTSYICSLTALKYKPGKPVAWMFLFTSNLMESDPLTDFQSQQYFEQHRAEISSGHPEPMGIVVCDLNRLSLLNSTIGRNGGGYPDHLQHESIPLLARIISVVDAYDAMVTDRVYRKGQSKKEACEELKRCAGTQFDPYIVDAFLQIHYPEMASEADAEIAGNRALMSLRRLEPDISPEGIYKKTSLIFEEVCRNISDLPTAPTISAGAVCSSHRTITFQELYTAADNELYAAKRRGKNQFSLRTKEETA